MSIFEHHQNRLPPSAVLEVSDERFEDLFLFLLRVAIENRITIVHRYRQKIGNQRNIILRPAEAGKGRLKLLQPLLRCVSADERQVSLPSCDDRVERAVLMVWRAETRRGRQGEPMCRHAAPQNGFRPQSL
jgi:hypothetical protein